MKKKKTFYRVFAMITLQFILLTNLLSGAEVTKRSKDLSDPGEINPKNADKLIADNFAETVKGKNITPPNSHKFAPVQETPKTIWANTWQDPASLTPTVTGGTSQINLRWEWGTTQTSAAKFPMRATGKLSTGKGGNGGKADPVWRLALSIPKVDLKSVDFLGTDNYTLRKQGNDSYANDKYEDDGDVIINYPEWQDTNFDGTPEKNDPACYKIGVKPEMTAVLKVGSMGVSDLPAKLKVLSGGVSFCEKNIKLKSGDNTITDLNWKYTYFGAISYAEYILDWQISFDDGKTFSSIASTKTRIFTVFGKPHGTSVTAKRLHWCTSLADEKITSAEIADVIGPDATGKARFSGEHSIHSDIKTAWEIMDGTNADCGSLSTLMKYELEQLGCSGAKVMYVYARNASWKGIALEEPGKNEINVEGKLGMWFAVINDDDNGWNNYEGCCFF